MQTFIDNLVKIQLLIQLSILGLVKVKKQTLIKSGIGQPAKLWWDQWCSIVIYLSFWRSFTTFKEGYLENLIKWVRNMLLNLVISLNLNKVFRPKMIKNLPIRSQRLKMTTNSTQSAHLFSNISGCTRDQNIWFITGMRWLWI